MIVRRFSLQSIALVVPLALGLSACTYEDRNHDCMASNGCPGNNNNYTPPPADNTPKSTIDTGAAMGDIQAGEGAGAFVEYAGDGKWHVFTTCDTKLSGAACAFDVITSVPTGSQISGFQADRLEEADFLDWDARNKSVRLVSDTTTDFDGYYFDATSGSTVRVDVYLDGSPAPRFIYWIGDGGVHSGAPSNPVDLAPSKP